MLCLWEAHDELYCVLDQIHPKTPCFVPCDAVPALGPEHGPRVAILVMVGVNKKRSSSPPLLRPSIKVQRARYGAYWTKCFAARVASCEGLVCPRVAVMAPQGAVRTPDSIWTFLESVECIFLVPKGRWRPLRIAAARRRAPGRLLRGAAGAPAACWPVSTFRRPLQPLAAWRRRAT